MLWVNWSNSPGSPCKNTHPFSFTWVDKKCPPFYVHLPCGISEETKNKWDIVSNNIFEGSLRLMFGEYDILQASSCLQTASAYTYVALVTVFFLGHVNRYAGRKGDHRHSTTVSAELACNTRVQQKEARRVCQTGILSYRNCWKWAFTVACMDFDYSQKHVREGGVEASWLLEWPAGIYYHDLFVYFQSFKSIELVYLSMIYLYIFSVL